MLTIVCLSPILAAGIQISEGASFDVPVVFAPNSKELQKAWLCITMKPLSSPGNSNTLNKDNVRCVYVCLNVYTRSYI